MKRKVSKFKLWLIYLAASIVVGLSLGFVCGWGWFLFTLFIFGYGDSAPSWINTVSDVIFITAFIMSIAIGQFIFLKVKNKRF
jgi:hypothetical protein